MGIELPEFEMPEEKSGIDDYFTAVKLAVAGQLDWNVLTDTVVEFFNFTKFVMYKDLDPVTWPNNQPPADHLLVKAIFEPQPSDLDGSVISEDEVDTKIVIKDSFVVLDAGSSQIAVIECVKAGKNLVVQGPPGTGSDPDFFEELFTIALLFQEWQKNSRLPEHSVEILEAGIPAPFLRNERQAGHNDGTRGVLQLLWEYQNLKAVIDTTFLPGITIADIEFLYADFGTVSRKFYQRNSPAAAQN